MQLSKNSTRLSGRVFFWFFSVLVLALVAFSSQITKDSKIFGAWRMYDGIGADVCIVEYQSVNSEVRKPVDRFTALGFNDRRNAPNRIRIVRTIPQSLQIARQLCEVVEAPIVTELSCAVGGDWRKLISEVTVCKG